MKIDPETGEIIGAEKFRCFNKLIGRLGKRISPYFGVSEENRRGKITYRISIKDVTKRDFKHFRKAGFPTAIEAAQERDRLIEEWNLSSVRKSLDVCKVVYKNCEECGRKCALVPLSQGLSAIVNVSDVHLIKDDIWCAHFGKSDGLFYAETAVDRKTVIMHNVLLGVKNPDHKDRNGLNNCRCNLREAPGPSNSYNKRKPRNNSPSDFKGLFKGTKSWTAKIKLNGKAIYLGSYRTEIEAAIAYNIGAKKYHGEFAGLNEIPEKYKTVIPQRITIKHGSNGRFE